MMGKVLEFKRPAPHDCYERQEMRAGGVVNKPCPLCLAIAARKRQHKRASILRGDAVRKAKGWKNANP